MLRSAGWLAWTVGAGVGMLLLVEAGVRRLRPEISLQSTSSNLFQVGRYGASHGLRPGASGESFGAAVSIDENGFRRSATAPPSHPRATILVLGDSVTFGVGVAEAETFVGRLQAARRDLHIINAAAPLYSLADYRNLLHHLPLRSWGVSHVYLFYTMNDILVTTTLLANSPRKGTWARAGEIVQWWQRAVAGQSKLYVLLKSLRQRDLSLAYFSYDLSQYAPGSPRLAETLSLLEEVRLSAAERGLALRVILLPCEPQLRDAPPPDAWRPQRLLSAFLAGKLGYLDLAGAFRKAGRPSRELFLYADHMHLSPAGHAIVFQAVLDDLRQEVDQAGTAADQLPGALVAVRRGSP
jgi:lysophospholipase L1-like esterase